jgi:hypothetical protein
MPSDPCILRRLQCAVVLCDERWIDPDAVRGGGRAGGGPHAGRKRAAVKEGAGQEQAMAPPFLPCVERPLIGRFLGTPRRGTDTH